MIKHLSFFLIILALSSCSKNNIEDGSLMVFKALEFTNSSLPLLEEAYPKYYLFDDEKKTSTANNLSVNFVLKSCATVKWICISDGWTNFAIKTGWKGEETEWVYNGFKYSVINEDYDLGKSDKSYFISSKSIDGPERLSSVFLYSIEKGLLSMTFLVNDGTSDKKLPVTFVRVI